MREQTITDFKQEVDLLRTITEAKVPNVNTMYDVFQSHDQLWIVTEYCAGGSVHTLVSFVQSISPISIRKCQGIHVIQMNAQGFRLQEKYIVAIVRELMKGLVKLHELGIIHRDLKGRHSSSKLFASSDSLTHSTAANIMITDSGGVQIIDFGVGATLEHRTDKRSTFIGTLPFMAPEFHQRNAILNYGNEVC